MKNFLNKKFVFISLIIIVGFILGLIFTNNVTEKSITEMKKNKTQYILEGKFLDKKRSIEDSFKRMYETARTISLLPGIRSISGDNVKNENEDIVADGRISQESMDTIQQLYNNLAQNVPVSEIYNVIEGLNFEAGETPFFMLDQLIIQKSTSDEGEEGEVNSDFPEESEEEEYLYYPQQIAQLKNINPTFNFSDLNEIPAVLSKVVRTCDNTQYQSKTHDDVSDAGGLLYSVPYYNFDNKLKGIISVVFRTNIIEAQLMNIPYVIVTEDDKKQAQKDGFNMPKNSVNFMVHSAAHNVSIYDRRNKKIEELVKKYPNGNNIDFFVEDLDIKSKEKFKLYYYIDEKQFSQELSLIKKTHQERVITLIILFLILLSAIFWIRIKELKNNYKIVAFANIIDNMTQNNINEKVKVDKKSDISPIAIAFNEYLEHKDRALQQDAKTIENITQVANEVSQGFLHEKVMSEPSSKQLILAKNSINDMLKTLEELVGSDINKIVSTLEEYSAYNFASKINTNSQGKIEEATKRLGVMVSEMLKNNLENGLKINQNADVLEQNVQTLNDNLSNQEVSLEEISTSISQIRSIIELNNQKINSMEGLTKTVETLSTKGNQLAQDSALSMDEINEQTKAIEEAIVVIDQIAFQTNILSLNAAVEAATAGEAGKGFAVVAQEVRNLASRSAEAAKEIKELVENATEKTTMGKDNSHNMIKGYEALNESIQKTTAIIKEIATAANEEKAGIALINDNIQNLNGTTKENSISSNETKKVAIDSTNIAKKIVEDVNKADFIGKE